MSTTNVKHTTAMEGLLVAQMKQRPSVQYRPHLFRDGNQWCALYGESLQDGCAGFGDTPEEAMNAFDAKWRGES